MEKIILWLLKFMADYGVALVITALVLYFAVKFGLLYYEHIKEKLNLSRGASHDEQMKWVLTITPEIKSVLREILLQTHCSRAYIFLFHNGNQSAGGYPFAYMSVKHEVLSGTAMSQWQARQNMPFELFDTLVTAVIKNETIVIDPKNKTEEFDDMVYGTMEKRGNVMTICSKLVDEYKRVIGFMGIDYSASDEIPFNEKGIDNVRQVLFKEAQTVSTLLYVKVREEKKGN